MGNNGIIIGFSLISDEQIEASKGVQRQLIVPSGLGQNNAFPLSNQAGQTPFALPFNGLMGGGMNAAQVTTNQLQQLLASMQGDSRTGQMQQMPGLLPQMAGGGNGMGQALGYGNNEENTLLHNPLTAPDGLTKDVLKGLMVGNMGELAPYVGNGMMGSPPNNLLNSFSNGPSNPSVSRGLASSLLNRPEGGEGFPSSPNFNFKDKDELSLLQTRHHHRHKVSKKKGKSDAVTKLLLSLLVDKLKDIYELDKLNTTLEGKTKLDLETTGKIGNELHSANHGNNTSHKAQVPTNQQTKETFQTNLSFPLTVADDKSINVRLKNRTKSGDKNTKDNFELDSSSIDKIIRGIEANQTTKITPSASKPMTNNAVNRQLNDGRFQALNSMDLVKSILGSDTLQKPTETLRGDSFIKHPDTGNFAEFHKIKVPLESVNQSANTPSRITTPINVDDIKPLGPADGIETAKITSLPSYSISSFLNKDEPESVKATNRVLSSDAQSPQVNSSSNGVQALNNLGTTTAATGLELKPQESDNYVEASRVLGSVYKKVKEPLARKSVETAIKAMLKLIESDPSYAKKENVPSLESVENETEAQGATFGLERSLNDLAKRRHAAHESDMKTALKMHNNRFHNAIKKIAWKKRIRMKLLKRKQGIKIADSISRTLNNRTRNRVGMHKNRMQ